QVEPSLLLHPLDFLGSEDDRDLAFFPGMNSPASAKLSFLNKILQTFTQRFHVVTMKEHAQLAAERLEVEFPATQSIREEAFVEANAGG
ncbi:MAG: hypothetical protein MI725_11250, partial [Pirellulales bacterium]|nr:hypothetical protein [Pirellulales bacterium]